MYKILIADDHPAIRFGMKMMIQEIFPSSQIEEAEDADSIMEIMKRSTFDLLLLDINMPDSDTAHLMSWLSSFKPATKVVIFTMSPEKIYGKRYLQLGAKGYLKKSSTQEEIERALKQVMNNKKYISAELAEILTDDLIDGRSATPFDGLSPREFEIMTLLLKGNSMVEICSIINLQYSTVSTHKQHIFEKLQVGNVLQLLDLAKTHGLVQH